jgi:hypothetical protein
MRARTPLTPLAGTAPLEVAAAGAGVADVAGVVTAPVVVGTGVVTGAVAVGVVVPVGVPDDAPEETERAE